MVLICAYTVSPIWADECMEGNCENGVGEGFTDEGNIYRGQWKDGLPHGAGKLTLSKGKYVEGIWEKGKLKEDHAK